jgi:hypothetical protein
VGKEGECLGHTEFAALLHAAGAEQQYATAAWVSNHLRWVVWKLACYERQFPTHLAGRMLTAAVLLDQLKYRCAQTARPRSVEIHVNHTPNECKSAPLQHSAATALRN